MCGPCGGFRSAVRDSTNSSRPRLTDLAGEVHRHPLAVVGNASVSAEPGSPRSPRLESSTTRRTISFPSDMPRGIRDQGEGRDLTLPSTRPASTSARNGGLDPATFAENGGEGRPGRRNRPPLRPPAQDEAMLDVGERQQERNARPSPRLRLSYSLLVLANDQEGCEEQGAQLEVDGRVRQSGKPASERGEGRANGEERSTDDLSHADRRLVACAAVEGCDEAPRMPKTRRPASGGPLQDENGYMRRELRRSTSENNERSPHRAR
jgi:hypothetical protein